MCVLKLILCCCCCLNLKKHTCCVKQGVSELGRAEAFFSTLGTFLDCIMTYTQQASFWEEGLFSNNPPSRWGAHYALAPGNQVVLPPGSSLERRTSTAFDAGLGLRGRWMVCGAQGCPGRNLSIWGWEWGGGDPGRWKAVKNRRRNHCLLLPF